MSDLITAIFWAIVWFIYFLVCNYILKDLKDEEKMYKSSKNNIIIDVEYKELD